MSKKSFVIVLFVGVLFFSCTKTLYDYRDYDDAVYTYISSDDKSDVKNVSKSYQSIVGEKELKKKNTKFSPERIPPGACADYAYILYQQNDAMGANFWFSKEIELYPESETYIVKLKQELGL